MSRDPADVVPGGPLILVARPGDVLQAMDHRDLTARERRRGAALRHPADRDSYVAAHLLVRSCAAALSGRAIGTLELVQRCADCGADEHGKPSVAGLPDLHVSLAHTRGAVVAGADRHPVAVDVEAAPPGGIDATVMSYALTAAEIGRVRAAADPGIAFLRHWVRKECLVKIGAARLDRLSEVDIDPATERELGGGRAISRFGPLHLMDWFDHSLDVVIAAAGSRPPVVRPFIPRQRHAE